MRILALEFSSAQRSVAIVQPPPANRPPHTAPAISEVIETGGRATRAIPMIETALRDAQLEREQIECVAVGLGPGSYAGVRAAIAFAQGWQLARSVKLLGISSVECIAEQAQMDGLRGAVNIVVDAQRDEFYLAKYALTERAWTELQPLHLASLTEVQEVERASEVLIGPEVTKWFKHGHLVFPRAAVLGQFALRRNDFLSGEKLEPIYLRETVFVKAPPPRIAPP